MAVCIYIKDILSSCSELGNIGAIKTHWYGGKSFFYGMKVKSESISLPSPPYFDSQMWSTQMSKASNSLLYPCLINVYQLAKSQVLIAKLNADCHMLPFSEDDRSDANRHHKLKHILCM